MKARRASLRQSLSELRAGLGETSDALDGSKEAITWCSDAAWVDTKVLEAAAQSQDMDALGEAAAFSSGEFLEGLAIDEPGFDQWLTAERERRRLLLAKIHMRLMTSAEQRGKLEEAINHGLKLLSLDRHGMTHWWDARFNKTIDAEQSLRLAEEDSRNALALQPHYGPAFMLRSGVAFRKKEGLR
jgi:DNA-binding SARP family transcriptional activator